jgi:predicted Rossmann fold nucleotide-binding protein DprA/Smf involved in DNA uptake
MVRMNLKIVKKYTKSRGYLRTNNGKIKKLTASYKAATWGGLAVIGSRNADETALDFARALGRQCAGEAMLAALGAGGKVIGILADNLGRATVSGKYRQAIRDGRLTLISACASAKFFYF